MVKVLMILLDGAVPDIMEGLIEKGELPNLSAIKEQGVIGQLRSHVPNISPIVWTSIMSGKTPAKHRIIDVLELDPKTYALRDGRVNILVNKEGNTVYRKKRTTKCVWNILSEKGMKSAVLHVPNTFPPDELEGIQLSGMGTPDLLGTVGVSTVYSTKPPTPLETEMEHPWRDTRMWTAERLRKIEIVEDWVETDISGPKKTSAPLYFHVSDGRLQIVLEKGVDLSRVPALSVGDWSDWFRVKFPTAEGICRFKLIRLDDEELRVYLSSVQISPYNPIYPISYPPDFSAELAREIGPYKTKSFWTDHDALQYGRISEETFLEDAYYSLRLKMKVAKHLLNTRKWDLFIAFQHVIDAVQHVFWAHMDPNHPSYTQEGAQKYGDVIPDIYRRVDEGVGEMLSVVDDDTTVIVMSDHAHGPCYGHVYLNTWLYRRGLLEIKKDTNEIDWERTKAYCIGFAGIHLNVKGRMSMGMVEREREYEDLRKEITDGLRKIEFHGEKVVDEIRLREDEYQDGTYFDLTPDVIPIFARGYMLAGNDAWGKALVDSPIVKEYKGKRFGTHTSTAPAQFGVLLMKGPKIKENIKVRARIIDVMPTLMPLIGLKVPSDIDGRILTECLSS